MQIQSLFPQPIGNFQLDRDFSKKEIKIINQKLETLNQNVGNKHSKDSQVLENPNLIKLKQFCLDALNQFTIDIFGNQIDLKITQSWLNVTKKNEYHHKHYHPNSFISGVLYIDTEESDKIYFHNPAKPQFLNDSKVFTLYNSADWWLPTPKGSLMLFMSSLEHSVGAVQGNKRISLSFNTFFNSDFGSKNSLTLLPVNN
jgi:uncharacterized protein (TIGR02466 family)